MSETVYGPIILALSTGLFGWLLLRGFRTGEMRFDYPNAPMAGRRKDQPIRFWLTAAFLALLTLMSLMGFVGMIFYPDGIF